MRTWRNRRLDLAETDRLLAGGTPDPEQTGLGGLLDALRAPASERELAGEQRAVARFVVARRDAVPAGDPVPGRRDRVRRPSRGRRRQSVGMVVLRIAAVMAVLTTGSMVLAAKTGNLPPLLQRRAHSLFAPLGVPAPSVSARPAVARPPIPVTSHRSPASPQPDRTPSATGPSDLTPVVLCQEWNAARKGSHGGTLPDPVREALEAAAKGQPSIGAFCAHVLSGNGKRATPTQPATTATATRTAKPGKGRGHGAG